MSSFPATLPIFPVVGALLLPHARLPLVAFEPRYIALVEDTLREGRMIGMVQPRDSKKVGAGEEGEAREDGKDDLYRIGCAGRIVRYEEWDDGRRFIVLKGVRRFRRTHEQERAKGGYRRFAVSSEEFALDEVAPASDIGLPRERLERVLRGASVLPNDFDMAGLLACGDEEVVNLLCVLCPFAPNEKQALLEEASAVARSRTVLTLLDMQAASSSTRH